VNKKHLKPVNDRLNKGKIVSPPIPTPPDPDETPAFCLKFFVPNFSIDECTREQKASFANTLGKLSKMTWTSAMMASRHKLGCEKIDRTAIRIGIPAHITKDVTLLAFRFWSMAPMIGYRSGRILHIIWIDPKRKAYYH